MKVKAGEGTVDVDTSSGKVDKCGQLCASIDFGLLTTKQAVRALAEIALDQQIAIEMLFQEIREAATLLVLLTGNQKE